MSPRILKHSLICSAILTAFAISLSFTIEATSGSSINHWMSLLKFVILAGGLILASLVSIQLCRDWSLRTGVRYSVFVLLLSIVFLAIPFVLLKRQKAWVIGRLETAYLEVSEAGTPFPLGEDVSATYFNGFPDSFSVGYWVSDDRKHFALYYRESSDEYAMILPNQHWEWRALNSSFDSQ